MFAGMSLQDAVRHRAVTTQCRRGRPVALLSRLGELVIFVNTRRLAVHNHNMPIVAAVFALAAAIWGAIFARRASLLVGCGLLVIVGYALGHEFWKPTSARFR